MDFEAKLQKVLADCWYGRAVLVNERNGAFELVDPSGTLPPDTVQSYHERGLVFGGILAVTGPGTVRAALDPAIPFSDATLESIGKDFAARCIDLLKHPKWYCTPDMRAN